MPPYAAVFVMGRIPRLHPHGPWGPTIRLVLYAQRFKLMIFVVGGIVNVISFEWHGLLDYL